VRTLGIDPGLSGAVALFGDGVVDVRRDFKKLSDITDAIMAFAPFADRAALEFVSAMPGQGVTSMFAFGKATGVAVSALVAAKLPYIEVTPQRWQGYFWDLDKVPRKKGMRKNFDSIDVASCYIPKAKPFLTRKKDHNSADALLIAFWYWLNLDAESSRHRVS